MYRSPLIPEVDTNALSVEAASLDLLHTLNVQVVRGRYLNAATASSRWWCWLGRRAAPGR